MLTTSSTIYFGGTELEKFDFVKTDFLGALPGAQNQSAHPIEEQLKALLFALYYQNRTCD